MIYRICNRESVRVDAAYIDTPIASYNQQSCDDMYKNSKTRGTMYLLDKGSCTQSFDRGTFEPNLKNGIKVVTHGKE